MRVSVSAMEWQAVGITLITGSTSYPGQRMLIPYTESARDLLREALALVEAGIAAQPKSEKVQT